MPNVVERLEGDGRVFLCFECPGCSENHMVPVAERGERGNAWEWNGSLERPTLRPSILAKFTTMTPEGWLQYQEWLSGLRKKPDESFESEHVTCHLHLTDGAVQFLADCTHAMAGKCVRLEPVES